MHTFPRAWTQACSLSRRALLQWGGAALASAATAAGRDAFALEPRSLVFPRDHGAHNDHNIEWWYITGTAQSGARTLGFQVTFFRSRVQATQSMQSQFAAKQLLFAHAAVTDVQGNTLWHDQRIARAGFGIAQASETDMQITLRQWTLARNAADGSYTTHIAAKDFTLDLQFTPTQALLLQGVRGLSRKGPDARQASFYYSQPQLRAAGSITLQGQRLAVAASQGSAWLDHEWSQELLHPQAVGWDWVGMNLFDGTSLTAFQLRKADGTALWAGGSVRTAVQAAQASAWIASPDDVQFQALQWWKSPLTGARYPVEWQLRLRHSQAPGAVHTTYTVKALIPNQELDSRNSTSAVYWEGLSDLFDSQGRHVGRGYLEMTGYAGPLKL
jgi:predicted secreted hydrolase